MKKLPIYYTYIEKDEYLAHPCKVYVKYCIDGDTFIGIKNGSEKRYRLANIDTPEKNTAWGIHSKVFLEHIIGKKNVYLKEYCTDRYGRIITEVYLDFDRTISVNDAIIKEGLSKVHDYRKVNGYSTFNDFSHIKKSLSSLWAILSRKGMFGSVERFYKNKPFKKPKSLG